MECGLAIRYPLRNDQSYVLKNYGDQLLGQVHHLTLSQVCLNESINQDVLIRGILFGWEDLKDGDFWCPLWEIIYNIDTAIFSRSGLLTRLCMLRTIHLLLQVCIQAVMNMDTQKKSQLTLKQCFMQTSGFRDIPAWYRPRYVTPLRPPM